MGASPCLPATSATVRLSQARLSRASATVSQTRVATSIWDFRNSGLTSSLKRASHSSNMVSGGSMASPLVSGSTSRYSSSMPMVKEGSGTLMAGFPESPCSP